MSFPFFVILNKENGKLEIELEDLLELFVPVKEIKKVKTYFKGKSESSRDVVCEDRKTKEESIYKHKKEIIGFDEMIALWLLFRNL